MPYQVSPVSVVVRETLSADRTELDIAYQVSTNWPPPMPSWDSLGTNVRPAVSLTENVAPDGQQSQPTIITSFDWVVVSETLHAVTYPHPVEAEPSIAMGEEVPARTTGTPITTSDKTELTNMRVITTERYFR
jgi:hypothetical protein